MRRLVTSDCGNFKTRYAEEAALFPNDVGRLALGAFLIVWFLVVPAAAGPYLLGVANLTGIAVIGATGLNLLTGYTGQITIGHGAFMGVGAYAAAILAARAHLPFWLAIPLAGIATSASHRCASRDCTWRSRPSRPSLSSSTFSSTGSG